MYCTNCGKELKETDKFCSSCGALVEKIPEQPMTGQPVAEQPMTENPMQMGSFVPKKKKGKNKIWLIVCVVVLVIAVSGIANAAKVNNFFHKTFSSPVRYYQYVEKKELDEIVDLIGEYYGRMVSNMSSDIHNSGEIVIEPGDDMKRLIKYANMFLDLDELGFDPSELESLKIGIDMSVKDNMVSYGLKTAINKVDLISANMLMDADQGELYLQIPELTKVYLGADLEDYIGSADELSEIMDNNKASAEAMPGQEEVEKLLHHYLTIALENIDNVSLGRKKELNVEGISQKCTELNITLDNRTMQKVLEAVLEEAQKDEVLEKMIMEISEAMDQDGDEIYEEFIENIDDMDVSDLVDEDTELNLSVYVNNKGDIIGIVLEQENSRGEKSALNMLSAQKGGNIAYEIFVIQDDEETIRLHGKGKKSGGFLTGDFELEVMEESAADLKVSKLDIEKLKQGYLNGKVDISLSSKWVKELSNELGISEIASLVKNASLSIDCKSSANSMDCKITLNYDEMPFLNMSLVMKSDKSSKISVPKENSVIMVESSDDIKEYYNEIEWDEFFARLEKTEVLSDLGEVLEDVLNDLEDWFDDLDTYDNSSY